MNVNAVGQGLAQMVIHQSLEQLVVLDRGNSEIRDTSLFLPSVKAGRDEPVTESF